MEFASSNQFLQVLASRASGPAHALETSMLWGIKFQSSSIFFPHHFYPKKGKEFLAHKFHHGIYARV